MQHLKSSIIEEFSQVLIPQMANHVLSHLYMQLYKTGRKETNLPCNCSLENTLFIKLQHDKKKSIKSDTMQLVCRIIDLALKLYSSEKQNYNKE